jgi:hypothetical protein
MQIARVATRKFSEHVNRIDELLKEKESQQNKNVSTLMLAQEAERIKASKKEKEVLLDDFNF